ncbi:ubiquitin carboxyl-terminal hydrolase 37 isoform X1 [Labeo rohita]|uniref:Ubiquitin carboxyl-terminal hydrolase n=1 Tax=Labeo rohita TaxID=84645 RepID=A0A498LFL3_LABRO|nr:ubiquitin carboxyl-terminal hydrolase 37 isoform X1 [Labeo rohita]
MAVAVPKLTSGGAVRIRIRCGELGTTKWKEGVFEIHERDNKINLVVKFNSGGTPRMFQLNHNVKQVSWYQTHGPNRVTLTLKDSSVVMMDKLSILVAKKMKEYLENSTPRRPSLDSREDSTPRKPLGSPSRVTSTPGRNGLSENRSEKRKRLMNSDGDMTEDYPKENDSSSNNKAITDASRKFLLSCKEKLKQSEENRTTAPHTPAPLQPTSFYGSRTGTKDYSQTHSFFDRPGSTGQCPSAKRSLMLPNHSTPFKKVRPTLDYGGWNKPRASTLAQPQPPLQGFSNLGNTCYMNAILQSLFSLPSFSNDLLKQGIPWKRVPVNALLRRFAHLLAKKDISPPEVKKDLLRRVKNAISSTAERFSGYMQNDAHEFLSQCLDQLKEDVEKINKSWKNEPSAWEEPQSARLADEVDTSRIYTCPVTVNMEFEVQHTITCKSCGEVVTKREQFNDLSIDLPRRKKTLPLRSIQDSLDLFFRMEEIEYSCEKCSGKAATVSHKFSRLPRVLILHLKRYSYNSQLSLNSKLGQQVLIPKYLTLLSHCTDATRPPLSLGWNAQTAISRTLKMSQSVNSSTLRKGSQKPESSGSMLCDSDSEEELVRKVGRKHHSEDERTEEVQHNAQVEHSEFNAINDEEMLAAVLEMSRHDTSLSGCPDDEPTSSPDTGFGDADGQDLTHHLELLDGEKQPADALESLDLTMDENKENQTPEGVQGELDWVQQYSLDQEREEQELQQALAQSLQEHTGELPNSFRLISVVSHIGSSSSSGHYISDVYDMKKQSWLTYNDLDVSRTQESTVQRDRDRSGYIFFYMHKDVFEELSELEKAGGNSDAGRTVLQPL